MSLQLSSNVRQNYRICHCVNKIEKCLTSLSIAKQIPHLLHMKIVSSAILIPSAPSQNVVYPADCSVPLHSLEHVRHIPNIRKKYTHSYTVYYIDFQNFLYYFFYLYISFHAYEPTSNDTKGFSWKDLPS